MISSSADSEVTGGATELKLDQLKSKLRKLEQGKKVLEEELKEAVSMRNNLQVDQDTLCTEALQLEMMYKEKEESWKVVQFKCEELEFDLKREQQVNTRTENIIQNYTFQIQEINLEHRKLRMKFETELRELMDQHKHLYSAYCTERLPAEIENLEKVKAQLLKVEELQLTKLNHLEEEVKQLRDVEQALPTCIE